MIFSCTTVAHVLVYQATQAQAKRNVVNHKIKTNEATALVVCGESKGKRVRDNA